MKNLRVIIIAFAFIFSGSVLSAQEWSDEQKEVWAFVQEYSDAFQAGDYEKFMGVFHEDYKGWSYDSPIPMGKEAVGKYVKMGMMAYDPVFSNRTPLSIQVYNDFAVVDYMFHNISKNKETGKIKESEGRWTDILMKDGKEWYLIADHGGSMDDD